MGLLCNDRKVPCTVHTPSILFFIVAVDFLSYVWPFVLFKIFIQICNIISCVWTLFSKKTNHNKIYNNFKNILNKMNGQKWSKKVNGDNKKRTEGVPCYQNQCILAQAPVEATVIAPVVVDTLFQDLRSNIPQHPPEAPNLWSTRYHW
jgi:hypothetical protein